MKLVLGLGLAVGGLVAISTMSACVSARNNDDEPFFLGPSGTTTSIPTSRPPPRPPSGSTSGSIDPDPPEDPTGCPSNVSLTASDLDKEVGWKNTLPAKGSCTAADITQLQSNFKNTNTVSYFDLAKGLSTECRACVLSKDTDARWGPIVGTAENDGETGFLNYGACFGAIEGDACGKAVQYEKFCQDIACNDCSFNTQQLGACVAKSGEAGQMCNAFATTKTKSCPSWTLNVQSCGNILDAVKTLCGP